MRIIGCDLHARQQTLAMLDSTTGEVVKATLKHEGNMVREFYDQLPRPVRASSVVVDRCSRKVVMPVRGCQQRVMVRKSPAD